MKKILLITVILTMFVLGCSMPFEVFLVDMEVVPDLGLDTVWEVIEFTSNHVAYISDIDRYGFSPYWDSPMGTYLSSKGDCEDFATLTMHILKSQLDIDSLLVMGWHRDNQHAWLEIDGVWIETVTGRLANMDGRYTVKYKMDYEEAMMRSVVFHQ